MQQQQNAIFQAVGDKNLKELADSVEVFRLINEAEEDVVDLLPDEGSESQEFAVDSMETGLEEIPLTRVLAVEQLQQLTVGG